MSTLIKFHLYHTYKYGFDWPNQCIGLDDQTFLHPFLGCHCDCYAKQCFAHYCLKLSVCASEDMFAALHHLNNHFDIIIKNEHKKNDTASFLLLGSCRSVLLD